MKKKETEGLPDPNSSWFYPPERTEPPAWLWPLFIAIAGVTVLALALS